MPDPVAVEPVVAAPAETPEQRADRLDRELADVRARYEATEKTLKALADREPAPAVAAPASHGDDAWRAQMRGKGYSDEQITQNLGILRDFIGHPEVGGGFAQALGTVADAADYAGWRASDRSTRDLSDDDLLAFDADVRKERKACVQRGEFRSYGDCAAIVKARKGVGSPKDQEAEIERRVAERLRTGAAAGITQRGAASGTQHAGPGPAGGTITSGSKSLSRDEFAALPLDKKREYLDQIGAQF